MISIVNPPQGINYTPPARVLINSFTGIRTLSLLSRIPAAAIKAWLFNPGSRGLIPAWYHVDLLLIAQKNNINLTAEDLIFGRWEDSEGCEIPHAKVVDILLGSE